MFTLGHKWKHLGYYFSECSPTTFMYSYIYIYIYIYIAFFILWSYALISKIFILILLSPFFRLSKRVFGNQNLTIHTRTTVNDAVVISAILYGCETWVPYRRHIRLLESFHIRGLQLILGLHWWHKVTYSEIRSRAGILSIESMLLQRQHRWLGLVIRMRHSRLPHCVIYGLLILGHRSVLVDIRNASNPMNSAAFPLTGWRLSHPTDLPSDLPVTLQCHTLAMNTIELQLSDAVADISMLQCSTQFHIMFINTHFVADNAFHALASSATVRPTYNVEEEVVAFHNGWTTKKRRRYYESSTYFFRKMLVKFYQVSCIMANHLYASYMCWLICLH